MSKEKGIFLVAQYYKKPQPHVNTSKKGWMDNPDNVQWDEQINIAIKLKNRDLSMAKVILDLSNQTVYRNGWNNGKSFEDLFEHFYDGYQKYLDPVLAQLGYEMVPKNQVENAIIKNETISSV